MKLSGKGKAQLAGLIKKIANLGIEGAADFEKEETQGVLQGDLVDALRDARKCKIKIWDDLNNKFQLGLGGDVRPKPIDFAGCPGNLLNGQHSPRGGHAPWTWSLDNKTGLARIWKPNHSVSGQVTMTCSQGRWSAQLSAMTHGATYNCIGDVKDGRLNNATCHASVPPVIDVSGIFSISAK